MTAATIPAAIITARTMASSGEIEQKEPVTAPQS